MKATIAGVTIEGTPQEIAEYQRLKVQSKPIDEVLADIQRNAKIIREAVRKFKKPYNPQRMSQTEVPIHDYAPLVGSATINVPTQTVDTWRN